MDTKKLSKNRNRMETFTISSLRRFGDSNDYGSDGYCLVITSAM